MVGAVDKYELKCLILKVLFHFSPVKSASIAVIKTFIVTNGKLKGPKVRGQQTSTPGQRQSVAKLHNNISVRVNFQTSYILLYFSTLTTFNDDVKR